jgi:hypothetical protein
MKTVRLLAICLLSCGLSSLSFGNVGNGNGNANGVGNGNGNGHAYGHDITAPELSLNAFSAGITALTLGGLFLRRKKSR